MSDWPSGMTLKPIDSWPGALTKNRKRSQFDSSLSSTLEVLRRELRYLGARGVVLQIALQEKDFRIDGYPRATARPDHPGIIISFASSNVGDQSYPCDTYQSWQDNLRAVALALEALRKVERYGVDKRGARYAGFKALPSGIVLPPLMSREEAAEVIASHTNEWYSAGQILASDEMRDAAIKRAKVATAPDRHDGNRDQWDRVDRAVQVLAPVVRS